MTTWIAVKPCGAVKIGATPHQVVQYQPVPQNIIEFWDKTKQTEALKGMGVIVSQEDYEKHLLAKKKKEEKEKAEATQAILDAQNAEEKVKSEVVETKKDQK